MQLAWIGGRSSAIAMVLATPIVFTTAYVLVKTTPVGTEYKIQPPEHHIGVVLAGLRALRDQPDALDDWAARWCHPGVCADPEATQAFIDATLRPQRDGLRACLTDNDSAFFVGYKKTNSPLPKAKGMELNCLADQTRAAVYIAFESQEQRWMWIDAKTKLAPEGG